MYQSFSNDRFGLKLRNKNHFNGPVRVRMTETIIIDSRFGYTALYHEQEALNVCRTVLRRVQKGIERLHGGFARVQKGLEVSSVGFCTCTKGY